MESEGAIKQRLNQRKEEKNESDFIKLPDHVLRVILDQLDESTLKSIDSKVSIENKLPILFWKNARSGTIQQQNKFDKKICIEQFFQSIKKEVEKILKDFTDFFTTAKPFIKDSKIKYSISSNRSEYQIGYDFYRINYAKLLDSKILPKTILIAAIIELFKINKISTGGTGQTLLHLAMTDWNSKTVKSLLSFPPGALDIKDQFGNTPRNLLEKYTKQCTDAKTLKEIRDFTASVTNFNDISEDGSGNSDLPGCIEGDEELEIETPMKFNR